MIWEVRCVSKYRRIPGTRDINIYHCMCHLGHPCPGLDKTTLLFPITKIVTGSLNGHPLCSSLLARQFVNLSISHALKNNVFSNNTCSVECTIAMLHAGPSGPQDECSPLTTPTPTPTPTPTCCTNPTMHQSHIPQCTILYQKCANVCTLVCACRFLLQHGALRNISLVSCGISEMGFFSFLSATHTLDGVGWT